MCAPSSSLEKCESKSSSSLAAAAALPSVLSLSCCAAEDLLLPLTRPPLVSSTDVHAHARSATLLLFRFLLFRFLLFLFLLLCVPFLRLFAALVLSVKLSRRQAVSPRSYDFV